MARISREEMNKRILAVDSLLEDHPDGLTVAELISGLATSGISLPKSAYQGVNIVLQTALKRGLVAKDGHKWKLLDESASEPESA